MGLPAVGVVFSAGFVVRRIFADVILPAVDVVAVLRKGQGASASLADNCGACSASLNGGWAAADVTGKANVVHADSCRGLGLAVWGCSLRSRLGAEPVAECGFRQGLGVIVALRRNAAEGAKEV